MSKFSILLALLLACYGSSAQNKKAQDSNAIKKMCGCYEVTFNFSETFNYSEDSTYIPSKTKTDKALEWVQLVTDTDNKISMQHLLIAGTQDNPYIVKHWRQDWEFENTHLYMYDANRSWNYLQLPQSDVKGQWSQKVFQVDDSPRYEGSASWVHVDGKSYWENETFAPLPRREYTTRSDYNVTLRRNRHEITNFGWVHDQDNDKILRDETLNDSVLAKEKGYNTYVKVNDDKCNAAQEWWQKHHAKWALVRAKWDSVFKRNKDLVLEDKVDNKVLFKYLFDDSYQSETQINTIINAFVKDQL